ncbi:MAG: sialic acid TRAP transporter substrate-binding protein SiaP [Gemmatimonadota bacterium]|nr:sialic acid TRAP transporter substrate-binding protein SiaP [Gemmatimonadota bacterium]
MRTTELIVIPVAVFLITALSCARGERENDTLVLRFSTVSVPKDAHTVCLYTFKEELEKSTGGKVKVEIFHSGQLFTQEAEQAAVRRGSVDMVYSGPNWLAEYIPYFSMFTSGYIFDSYEHMTRVFNGEIGKRIFDDVAAETGVRPLGAFYLGTRQLNLRDIGRQVRSPGDLKGVKLRMPNSPTWLFLGRALGASPTTISFTELYMALKTGAVDGQDNPLPTTKNAKFYEVTKYIILTGHCVNSAFPVINEKLWQSLGPELQARVYSAIEKARLVCDRINLEAEAEMVDFFKDQGLTVIVPDKEAFMARVHQAYSENSKMTDEWDMDLYKKVQALAE